MTRLSRLLRNRWVWSLPVLLGAVIYGMSLLEAQEQNTIPPVSPVENSFGGMVGGMGGMLPVITWVKPQGEKPDWLTRGENAIRARKKMRRKLDEEGEFQFNNQPLSSVVSYISDTYGFQVHIDHKGLEDETVTVEEPITLHTKGSLRSILRRILDPLNLDHIVREDHLEITSRVGAISKGPVLSYNLAHVANISSEGESIVSTIKSMVQPDEWGQGGGNASCHLIGSVLLVKASEGMHEEIERLLAQLNAMKPDEKK